MTEFNLSVMRNRKLKQYLREVCDNKKEKQLLTSFFNGITEQDKEFIRLLKEEVELYKVFGKEKILSFNFITKNKIMDVIDKLAGDELSK